MLSSLLAQRTIGPVTLLERINALNIGAEVQCDDDSVLTIVSSEKPQKKLFHLALHEDHDIGEELRMGYTKGVVFYFIPGKDTEPLTHSFSR